MRTTILNVPFDTDTMKGAMEKLKKYLHEDKHHIVITPNPEIVLAANEDPEFMRIIKQADLVIPDGIGVVMASKLNRVKIKERVAGYDLVQNLFSYIQDKNYKVYFFGAGKGVAALAKEKMEKKYPGIQIVGVSDGYFDEKKEILIMEEIQQRQPDILLIGLGAPKQEKWVAKYKDQLPVKITCCIGGSFDVMSGKLKRAPIAFQRLGLEWFHRLLCEPTRIGRMMRLPLFLMIVIKEKIKEGFHGLINKK